MTNILAFWAHFLWRKWSVVNTAPALCSRISFLVWLYLIHIARPDTYGCCSWLNEQKFYLTWLICTKIGLHFDHSFFFYFFCFPWQSASRNQQRALLAKQAVPITNLSSTTTVNQLAQLYNKLILDEVVLLKQKIS